MKEYYNNVEISHLEELQTVSASMMSSDDTEISMDPCGCYVRINGDKTVRCSKHIQDLEKVRTAQNIK